MQQIQEAVDYNRVDDLSYHVAAFNKDAELPEPGLQKDLTDLCIEVSAYQFKPARVQAEERKDELLSAEDKRLL